MNFMDMYFIDLLSRVHIASFIMVAVGLCAIVLRVIVLTDLEGSYKLVGYIGIALIFVGFLGLFLSPSQELIDLLRRAHQ